jgi:hypothetical protein
MLIAIFHTHLIEDYVRRRISVEVFRLDPMTVRKGVRETNSHQRHPDLGYPHGSQSQVELVFVIRSRTGRRRSLYQIYDEEDWR